MKITCIAKDIKKVLETDYFHIPRFQRPYSWEKEHIEQFWTDTTQTYNKEYFIGSFVLFIKDGDLYGIVDGQQRITTITLIFCALRDFYISYELEDQAKGVHNLVEKVDLDNKKNFILQTETSYPYFQEHIQKYGDPEISPNPGNEELNLKKAFELIKNYISKEVSLIEKNKQVPEDKKRDAIEKKLNLIRNCMLNLNVIDIKLDNEEDAHTVFETLNTRGKDLNVSDLIKTYLAKNIKIENEKVDLHKDKWSSIVQYISRCSIDFDTFFLHHWLSKYEHTTKKKLFKRVQDRIKGTLVKEYLDDLVSDSETYSIILDPELCKWTKNELCIKKSLNSLSLFKVVLQTPMTLSILRNYFSKHVNYKFVRELLSSIENFHYIFNAVTSQRSSGSLSTMYASFAKKITNANDNNEIGIVVKELKDALISKLPTYEEFLANFSKLKYIDNYRKDKKIIQYTMESYNSHYDKSGVPINYDLMTIEHIYPQNPDDPIGDINEFVGTVGNLIFVDEHTNNKLGNKKFSEKKKILEKSNIFCDEYLLSSSEWTSKEIEKRTEDIAKKIYNEVFKI